MLQSSPDDFLVDFVEIIHKIIHYLKKCVIDHRKESLLHGLEIPNFVSCIQLKECILKYEIYLGIKVKIVTDLIANKLCIVNKFKCGDVVHKDGHFSFEFLFTRTEILRVGTSVAVIDSELLSIGNQFHVAIVLFEFFQ